MHSTMAKWILTVAAIAAASAIVGASAQQQARQQPARAQPAEPAKDYDQRSLEIYEFRRAVQSGPARGQEIYYYKCWMCHNELAQGGAPKLGGLFKRPTLVTGEPVNDETVKNQIRNGSPNMGAYKYALNEADLNDLVSWLHDEKCCWNSDAPPLNPRYKGSAAVPAKSLYGSLTGGPKEIAQTAQHEYAVTFPIAAKAVVVGAVVSDAVRTASERFSRPLPIPPCIGSAFPRSSAALAWSNVGSTCNRRAAAPAASGALKDVPHAPA